jgi:hypothetical protein
MSVVLSVAADLLPYLATSFLLWFTSARHFLHLFDLWSNNGFEIYDEISRPFAEVLDDIICMPRKVQLNISYANQQTTACEGLGHQVLIEQLGSGLIRP